MKTLEQIKQKIEELNVIVYDEEGDGKIWDMEAAESQIEILEWVLEEEQ